MMTPSKLLIVGGFLGAGKTSFLCTAAQTLTQQGKRVALITNDQSSDLVDSRLLSLHNFPVEEVSGSCFCCNYPAFAEANKRIARNGGVDITLAEPVGSCTDLLATVVRASEKHLYDLLQTAPLTVLADPARLASILSGETAGLQPDGAYIYRKQLEEADVIFINKIDLLTPEQALDLQTRTAQTYPAAVVMTGSALTGEGIGEWLDVVTGQLQEFGKRALEMNYSAYAKGEASMGWLNGTVVLQSDEPTDWNDFARRLLAKLSARFEERKLTVGHVKVLIESGTRYVVANLTGAADTLSVRQGTVDTAKLTLNARVDIVDPNRIDRFNELIKETLHEACGDQYRQQVLSWSCLSPGAPNPTYRYMP
ncbi:MAG: cobalamin synthesis protein P47K [Prevotellaceae bacterium]|jgi:G3E family GTPase|nr:cobalamin synthesis protein P47K [Prevotellaceae bacterium]